MAAVYVLYTGGTIGCTGDPLAPMPGAAFAALVGTMPGLGDGRVAGYPDLTWTIDWFDRPLDSSAMTPADWVRIARRLVSVYDRYDAFVVLHGTDTMAFSASALSFLLPGLTKPVVLTGSQVPLAMTLSDALPNLVGAIVMAGIGGVAESTLYFDTLLLRGNRSVKVNANRFAAFASPNFAPLATVGTEIAVDRSILLPPSDRSVALDEPAALAALTARLDEQAAALGGFAVAVMTLYPGITASVAEALLEVAQPPVRGVVIQAFGEGNGPSGKDFLAVLSKAHDGGVVLMDNTQVLAGTVDNAAYATGSALASTGAIGARDMTSAASLTKLVHLLSLGLPADQVRAAMQANLAGEITPPDTDVQATIAIA